MIAGASVAKHRCPSSASRSRLLATQSYRGHRYRLGDEVGLQGFRSTLRTVTRILDAAEGHFRPRRGGLVDPQHADLHLLRQQMHIAERACERITGKAIRQTVCLGNRLLE